MAAAVPYVDRISAPRLDTPSWKILADKPACSKARFAAEPITSPCGTVDSVWENAIKLGPAPDNATAAAPAIFIALIACSAPGISGMRYC